MQMANASAVKPQPTMMSKPQMVENHSGSSVINQSIAANVTVKPNKTMPGPLTFCMRSFNKRRRRGSVVVSCSSDHLFSRTVSPIQTAK